MTRWRGVALAYWPWLAIPILAIPAFWTYTAGFPGTADGVLHLLRTALLDVHLRQGVLFPRWVPELVLGYGYPVFNFYGPSTYYLAEGLHLLGLGYYQALMGAFAVMVVVGGYGMYLLAGAVFGQPAAPWPALVAAVAYMYAPYLLTNVFIRAAIGEVGAQALLPWIFWSFHRLLRHPRPQAWVLPAAFSLGALACTHNITLIFLPPALLGYVAVLWWPGRRNWRPLAWAGVSMLAAVAISAFFWAPLAGERQYLARTAYGIARKFLPENAWTWNNFLGQALVFDYTFAIPFRLGLVQLGLAVVGFVLARRRDAGWLFWLLLAVLAGLGIGAWAVPIWLSNDILLVAQFQWRLLAFVSVALAVLTGGAISRLRAARWQAIGGVGLVCVIIAANTPHLRPSTIHPTDNSIVSLPAITQFEADTSGLGTSSADEFMPRWVLSTILDPASAAQPEAAPPNIQLVAVGSYERVLDINSAAAFELRLTDFYYPGWAATLDGNQPLATYPSTNMGLLAVKVPAGTHRVRLAWQGTSIQFWATLVSLASLLALAVFQWRQRRRWAAVLPGLLLLVGVFATARPLPAPWPVQSPAGAADEPGGLQLLGYRFEQSDPADLYLYPYWQVRSPVGSLLARWRLTDSSGQVISEIAIAPYFGGGHTTNWPANALVDDAYRLVLPPGLAAGQYDLWLELQPAEATGAFANGRKVGSVTLGAVPAAAEPALAQPVGARFGPNILLAGFNLQVNRRPVDAAARPVLRPGDELDYTLYWRALAPVTANYHGFIHLLDSRSNAPIKQDQLAGSWFRAPVLWDTFYLQPDAYEMQVPAGTPGGLYWPRVGLYQFDTLAQLPVQSAAGQSLGSDMDLPPVKVLAQTPAPPEHIVSARFADVATLWGYQLEQPLGSLHPGSSFTLTLYYRSESATTTDYTHFIHLQDAAGNLAAHNDSPPQQGVNPTSAWVPGEVIVDPVVLTVDPAAAAGSYRLSTGLYDPAAGGARLGAVDQSGSPLADDDVILTELAISP